MIHPAFWWLVIGLAVIVGAAVLRILEKRRQLVHKLEEEQLLLAEIQSGRRLPDGRLACRVCHVEPAAQPLPAITTSRFDRHPLRELHALGPMYEIDENDAAEKGACKPCRRMVLKRLDAMLAEKRARRAIYNAAEAQEISREEAGALRWAQEQWEANARQIGAILEEPMLPQLPASTPGVIEVSGDSLPPSRSGSMAGEE